MDDAGRLEDHLQWSAALAGADVMSFGARTCSVAETSGFAVLIVDPVVHTYVGRQVTELMVCVAAVLLVPSLRIHSYRTLPPGTLVVMEPVNVSFVGHILVDGCDTVTVTLVTANAGRGGGCAGRAWAASGPTNGALSSATALRACNMRVDMVIPYFLGQIAVMAD